MSERSYIVECLSPVLRAFRNSFPEIKYEWIEKDIRSIKDANNIFLSNMQPRKSGLLILRLSDATEILDIEVSGPFNSNKKHTVGNAKKLLPISVCGLCRILANNFDCSIKDAKELEHIAFKQFTLFATSLIDKKKYLATSIIPFSFDAISSDNNNGEDLREWIHQPDDDLAVVTEDDMDEIFL
ncbi:7731_t:CDS:2 [Funneliformis geosporum]|uniref:13134_t:CDS:1 n=1 Tax=Funneliformis geosporum TaxID=1117311 RepID=A0A9W4WXB5_9GLOM|nr:7731_t:CDS:2 [Funneliformis geosporum]CAI2179183.1 13134_t:CDS:2 [Funneliformis geosporum]